MLLFSKWRTIYFRFTIIFEVDMWYSHSCFVRLKVEHRQCKVQIPQIIVIYDCKIVECANRRKFALCVGNCTNTRTILDYQYCITVHLWHIRITNQSICAKYFIQPIRQNLAFLKC